MPFVTANSRTATHLQSFYLHSIKGAIEAATALRYRYVVSRSAEDLIITKEIIRNLHSADLVVCDLSGPTPNPNVMYELGVRFALSAKPVILIREQCGSNQAVFDLKDYFTYHYDPHDYPALEQFLVAHIGRLENGEVRYESPVLASAGLDVAPAEIGRREHAIAVLRTTAEAIELVIQSIDSYLRLFLQEYAPDLRAPSTPDQWIDLVVPVQNKLPWENLNLEIGTPPALEDMFRLIHTETLVDEDLMPFIKVGFASYYGQFFICGYRPKSRLAYAMEFLIQSFLTRAMIHQIFSMIGGGESGRAAARKALLEMFKGTRMVHPEYLARSGMSIPKN